MFDKPETICWTCENALGDCSWHTSFTPVDGWDAIPTKIKGAFPDSPEIDSYCVLKCPNYRKEKRGQRK